LEAAKRARHEVGDMKDHTVVMENQINLCPIPYMLARSVVFQLEIISITCDIQRKESKRNRRIVGFFYVPTMLSESSGETIKNPNSL
jgi:hypothetical protein